jgi:hypothetical protein
MLAAIGYITSLAFWASLFRITVIDDAPAAQVDRASASEAFAPQDSNAIRFIEN